MKRTLTIVVLCMLLLATVGTTAVFAAAPSKFDVTDAASGAKVGTLTIKTDRTSAMTYTLSASKLDPTKKYDLWDTATNTILTDANTPLQPAKNGNLRATGSFTGSVTGATFELRQRSVELTLEVTPTTVPADEGWKWTITLKGWNPVTQQYLPLVGEYVEAYVLGSEGYFGAGTTDANGQIKGENSAVYPGTYSLQAIYQGNGVYAAGESNAVTLNVGPELIHTTLTITGVTWGDSVQIGDLWYYSTVQAQGTLTDVNGAPLASKNIDVSVYYYDQVEYKSVYVATAIVQTDGSGNWDSGVIDISDVTGVSLNVLAVFNADSTYQFSYNTW